MLSRAMLCCAVPHVYCSGVKVQGLWLSATDPGRAFVGLNRREKSVFDIHSVDVVSRKMVLDTVNPGNVTAWVVSPSFQISVGGINLDQVPWQQHTLCSQWQALWLFGPAAAC